MSNIFTNLFKENALNNRRFWDFYYQSFYSFNEQIRTPEEMNFMHSVCSLIMRFSYLAIF